ncbi:PilZ domain-containing protein [Clostridiaceae bacterium UIB06]|uniref:PilZ domain-containing protein n=1 Tax=Clostridium thailandense TaxID=2794346 RepID=A0A949TMV8_9CLOT|nr:flagellar brake domain-containing protein [Clostridium thailandense]MBV7272202.1 PilZ domain-containing protein [Clostridium thailandense]MCH5136513.1 PilZ domain-containing protein [Clostridiaceae bacterium UIB06]
MKNKVEFLINQKIEIEMEDGVYKSNIQDITDEYIGISIPVNNGKYVPLRKGERVTGIYYINKDIYKFETVVIGRKVDKLLIIMLGRPDKVVMYQRRNFVRVQVMINVYCVLLEVSRKIENIMNNQVECFDAYTLDISGGGMRIALDRNLDKKVELGNLLMVNLPIENENLAIKCKVVRVENDNKNPKIIYGLSFVDLDRKTREEIVGLVFKIMREQMKNGAKGE